MKLQPDKEVITTFIYEWLNDDSRAETEYKKILETGSDNQSLSQPLQKYFITEAAFQSFLKTFYYLPVKILQQYDSYNLIDINITKESNSYFVKVDLELIKEEKSKNHSITIKIQMDHKKFTYFTITHLVQSGSDSGKDLTRLLSGVNRYTCCSRSFLSVTFARGYRQSTDLLKDDV